MSTEKKSNLTATVTDKNDTSSLEAMMKADLNSGMIDGLMAGIPNIGKYIDQAKPFIPMAVNQAKNFFGKDAIRIMIYMEPESGAFIFEKLHTNNMVEDIYKSDPNPADFFVIKQDELDNPEGLLKTLMKRFNLNLI